MAYQFCVVCSQGSSRSTWNNTFGAYVACDYHSIADILTAISNAGGSPTTGADLLHQDPSVDESPAA